MKTLLLLRHAKSSWKNGQLADHDRPLNKRGKRDAPRIGKLLLESGLQPELILSSTAKRARKTASKVARKCAYEGVIELNGTLYLAAPDDYIRVLRDAPDHFTRVMVVGHNPGLEQLLAVLTGNDAHLPTAALAQIQVDIDTWSELQGDRCGRLIDLWRPRELH